MTKVTSQARNEGRKLGIRLAVGIVLCATVLPFLAQGVELTDYPDYTVAAGHPETWTHVTNQVRYLYLHDNLTVGANGNLWVYSKTPVFSKVYLPAAAGEDVTLSFVNNGVFNDKSGSVYTDVKIGENGGKGKLSVGGYNLSGSGAPSRVWVYNTAEAGDDGFVDFLEIADGGYALVGEWYIKTTSHPARIRLHGKSGFNSRTFVKEWFNLESNVQLFLHGDDGGQIIINHDTSNSYSEDHRLVNNPTSSRIVTTGACDVVFSDNDQHVGKRRLYLRYKASLYDWAHSGNTIVRGALTLCPMVDNVLPCGPRTGKIRLESPQNKTPTLDLTGTVQRVNGIVGVASTAMVTNSSPTAYGTVRLGTWNEDTEFSVPTVSERVRVFKEGTGNFVLSGCTMPHLVVTGGEMQVPKSASVGALSISGVVVRITGGATLSCGTLAATNTTFLCDGGTLYYATPAFGEGNTITFTENGQTNLYMRAVDICGRPFEKEGASFLTCETSADAHGQSIRVKGGTLRFGGSPCGNRYWRFIAKESKGTQEYTMPDGSKITVALTLGTIGLFTDGGLDIIGNVSAATTGSAISGLAANRVVSAKDPFFWNNDQFVKVYGKAYGVTAKDNPIGNGASYMSLAYSFGNANGAASNTYDTVDINSWWGGTLYTNKTLVAGDSSTWETVGWRVPDGSAPACSYNLAVTTNLGNEKMQVKSWELQSSPDGVTWETMDERSGQSSSINAPRRFMYNNHIPYLFSAKKNDWHFTTYGTVRVDTGAVLDLTEIPSSNIAVNALAVDLSAGAGTIKRFVPAAGGTIDLLNPSAGMLSGSRLKPHVTVPLTLTEVSGESNLETWQVNVNGVRSPASSVAWRDGHLVVETMSGTTILFR